MSSQLRYVVQNNLEMAQEMLIQNKNMLKETGNDILLKVLFSSYDFQMHKEPHLEAKLKKKIKGRTWSFKIPNESYSSQATLEEPDLFQSQEDKESEDISQQHTLIENEGIEDDDTIICDPEKYLTSDEDDSSTDSGPSGVRTQLQSLNNLSEEDLLNIFVKDASCQMFQNSDGHPGMFTKHRSDKL